jgi:hypothetical protein
MIDNQGFAKNDSFVRLLWETQRLAKAIEWQCDEGLNASR